MPQSNCSRACEEHGRLRTRSGFSVQHTETGAAPGPCLLLYPRLENVCEIAFTLKQLFLSFSARPLLCFTDQPLTPLVRTNTPVRMCSGVRGGRSLGNCGGSRARTAPPLYCRAWMSSASSMTY